MHGRHAERRNRRQRRASKMQSDAKQDIFSGGLSKNCQMHAAQLCIASDHNSGMPQASRRLCIALHLILLRHEDMPSSGI